MGCLSLWRPLHRRIEMCLMSLQNKSLPTFFLELIEEHQQKPHNCSSPMQSLEVVDVSDYQEEVVHQQLKPWLPGQCSVLKRYKAVYNQKATSVSDWVLVSTRWEKEEALTTLALTIPRGGEERSA